MFLLTFIRYRPDMHARWVKNEHSANVFFPLLVFYKLLVSSPTASAVAIKLGDIYHWLI